MRLKLIYDVIESFNSTNKILKMFKAYIETRQDDDDDDEKFETQVLLRDTNVQKQQLPN
ncbi:unnamed protein product, partial [Didymodactylos carnosus]